MRKSLRTDGGLVAVVDDDPSMCRMLSRCLQASGFTVKIFRSAEEFLKSGCAKESVCLILDVDLPGMKGPELQRALNETGCPVPMIFISGQADEETGAQTLGAGAVGFFNKPFSIDSLLATISRCSA